MNVICGRVNEPFIKYTDSLLIIPSNLNIPQPINNYTISKYIYVALLLNFSTVNAVNLG